MSTPSGAVTDNSGKVIAFVDTAENFHPFCCEGPGECIHCDSRKTDDHDPAECALCLYMEVDL